MGSLEKSAVNSEALQQPAPSTGPHHDTGQLQQGSDRVELALAAPKDSKLTAEQHSKLQALAAQSPVTGKPSVAVVTNTGGRSVFFNGQRAVVDTITVKGKEIEVLLSDGSFNKTVFGQWFHARKLNCRFATYDENLAFLKKLIEKEMNGSLNRAEKHALRCYEGGEIGHSWGALSRESSCFNSERKFIDDFTLPVSYLIPEKSNGRLYVIKKPRE